MSGASWAALVSRYPELQVEIEVDEIVNIEGLARILLPEIPLVEFTMKAYYSRSEEWSASTILSDMLPQYRSSLKVRALSRQNNWVERAER